MQMHTPEWEYYATCSRLKTERTKKRLQKKDLDKQLLQNYKKLRRIWKEQWNLGYTDLVPPVQKGWKRFFVLREDVTTTKDALLFQQILDKINMINRPQFSFRKDFKVKRKQKGKKIYVDRPQLLPVIELYELRKIKLTEQERMYFNSEQRCDQYRGRQVWRTVLVFKEPWRFVLKVAPNMITQVRIIDPALMKAEAELKNHLIKNDQWNKMHKVVDGYAKYNSNWNGHDKMKYRSLFKTESVSKIGIENY
jgi:hypothetical protein